MCAHGLIVSCILARVWYTVSQAVFPTLLMEQQSLPGAIVCTTNKIPDPVDLCTA